MKTFFSYFILFCLSLVMLVSCVSKKPTEPVIVTKTKTIREVVKDTVFTVKADSSYYKAFIECINGKPVIATSFEDYLKQNPKSETSSKTTQAGTYLKTPKVKLSDDGVLEVDCEAEAQKLFKSWKQTYTHETEPVIVKVPVPVEKPYPWYVKTQLWAGRIFLLITLLIVSFFIYKLLNK